ncbi:MAG: BamA/TamA family outer membrane protein [Bacteroidota bacterium]
MIKFLKYTTFLLVIASLYSCNNTFYLKNNEKLLGGISIKIKGDQRNVNKDDLMPILKQKPNKKILGVLKFHLGVYNFAKRGKERKWKKWLIDNVAEEPVIYDSILKNKSTQQIKLFLDKKGYFDSTVKDTVITRKKRVRVIYSVKTLKPYLVNSINYSIKDTALSAIVFNDTINSLIKKTFVFDQSKLEKERERISNLFKNNGYYYFSVDFVRFKVDSFMKNKLVNVEVEIKDPSDFININLKDKTKHNKYFIRKILVYPEYDFLTMESGYIENKILGQNIVFMNKGRQRYRKDLFLNSMFIVPNEPYNLTDANLTYDRLSQLKIFGSVKLEFNNVTDSSGYFLDAILKLGRTKSQSYSLELQGTNSAGNYGIQGNVTFQNKNIFKGGEVFRVKGAVEIKQVPVPFDSGIPSIITLGAFNTIEFGPEVSLSIPKLTPNFKINKFSKAHTIYSTAFNYQKNPNYFRTIFNTSFGYSITKAKTTWAIYPLELNFVNVTLDKRFEDAIANSNNVSLLLRYQSQFFNNLRITFTNSNQSSAALKNNYYLKLNGELAGVIPTLINEWTGKPRIKENENSDSAYYYFTGIRFNNPYAQFAKFEIDYRYYFRYSVDQTLVLRSYSGIGYAFGNSSTMPFVKSFFAGGADDIRAWRPRTLGPGSFVGNGFDQIERIGDFKLTLNAEYRFKVYKYLNAALFADAGNIWLLNTDRFTNKTGGQLLLNKFFEQLAMGAGVGFRFDFSFFIVRLDVGVPIYDPKRVELNQSNWIIGNLKDSDINFLNLGIGYPF